MIDVIDPAGGLDREIEAVGAADDAVEEVAHLFARDELVVIAGERGHHRVRLRERGAVDRDADTLGERESLLQERAHARRDREERFPRGAGAVGGGDARRFDPVGDALHALGDVSVGIGVHRGLRLDDALAGTDAQARFTKPLRDLGLLLDPLGAADARLLRDRARELRAEHALERAHRERQQFEHAIRITRRVRELEGERQELHRGAPFARARLALLRQTMTRERGVEQRASATTDDDGVLAMLREERGGELGEIAGRVSTKKKKRAVASDGGAFVLASRGNVAAQHLVEDAEVRRRRLVGDLGNELRDDGAALLKEHEDRLPARWPERVFLDEGERVVDAMLRRGAQLLLDAREAIGASGWKRLDASQLDRREGIEAIASARDGLAVPARVDERIAP